MDAIIHQVEQYKKSLKQKTNQTTDLVVCVYVAIGQSYLLLHVFVKFYKKGIVWNIQL